MQGADDLLAEILEHIIREKKKEEISDGDKESALVNIVVTHMFCGDQSVVFQKELLEKQATYCISRDRRYQGTTEWLSLRGRDTVMTNSCVMQREATHVQSIPRFKQSTVQQELSAEAIHKEIKKKESKKKRLTVTIL